VPRKRDPRRDEAFEIFKKHSGDITNRSIGEKLDVPEKTISAWKARDKWNAVLQKKNCSTTNKKKPEGADKQRNRSGNPNPARQFSKRNSAAVSHGFFRTIFPDDEETLNIVDAIASKGPVDMLWESIVIKYTAIARAQKLMYVSDQDDTTKELKKEKEFSSESGGGTEEEWEIQFAWDKHATFLTAQSRAMSELRSLIKDFIQLSGQDDHRRAQLEKMQHDMKVAQERLDLDKAKANIDDGEYEDDGFHEALEGKTAEVWEDE